ncbi:MAG: PQQ-binding-like beta-propeller repeat protein [Planctomycetota bacterium]|nr:PQQ-binding-like beta-propeller repeat protein [Planctomycetota bacterium]
MKIQGGPQRQLAAVVFLVGASLALARGARAAGTDTAPQGSPDFYPSPSKPVGWRGDGTGRYPAATPVLEWSYHPKSPNWGLKYQPLKPAAGDAGQDAAAVESGEILEWLVLGPFEAVDKAKPLDGEFLPNEAGQSPTEGDKVGDMAWTKHVSVKDNDGTVVNSVRLDAVAKGKPGDIVYAHNYLYSKTKGAIELYLGHGKAAKIWINGTLAHHGGKPLSVPGTNYVCYAAKEHWHGELLNHGRAGTRVKVELEQGWNRILLKANGHVTLHLVEAPGTEYERKNVVWVTPLPNWSNAMPIVVGEKVFLMAEPDELLCLNKADGRILWKRRTTFVDAASAEDRRRFPAEFKELDALNATLKETAEAQARVEIRKKMRGLLKQVDRRNIAEDPDYREIYKFQAVLKDANAAPEAKEQAAASIRAQLAGLKGPRETNPLYQVIEPMETALKNPATKDADREALKKKLPELLAKLAPKPKYEFEPSSHIGGIGYACPTPIGDGEHVYVLINGMGIAGCYDLEGRLKWAALVTDMGDPGAFHNNLHALYDGKMIVLRGSVLRALDAATGTTLWTSTDLRKQVGVDIWHGYGTHASYSGSPIVAKFGGIPCVFFNASITRLSDGEVLQQVGPPCQENVRSTPLLSGGYLWFASHTALHRLLLDVQPAKELKLDWTSSESKWETGDISFYSSPSSATKSRWACATTGSSGPSTPSRWQRCTYRTSRSATTATTTTSATWPVWRRPESTSSR